MSLDVCLERVQPTVVYSSNITHNLGDMAQAVGIYMCLWRPDEMGIGHASQLIPLLQDGLQKLKGDPEKYKKYNATNGWGVYEQFVLWVEEYLKACEDYPDAAVRVSR